MDELRCLDDLKFHLHRGELNLSCNLQSQRPQAPTRIQTPARPKRQKRKPQSKSWRNIERAVAGIPADSLRTFLKQSPEFR